MTNQDGPFPTAPDDVTFCLSEREDDAVSYSASTDV